MTKHDERAPAQQHGHKYEMLAGAVAGAYMAMESGADPKRCMKTAWDFLQNQLAERSKREGR